MADPKTNRALGQTSSRVDADPDEDPLVELARIVSEDSGFSGSRADKPRIAPREGLPARDALADGLEAELLQELESSFAVREAPAAKPRASVSAPRVNPTPADARQAHNPMSQRSAPAPVRPRAVEDDSDPDELLRSIEEQLSQFERRQSGRFVSAPSTFTPEPIEPEGANGADAPFDQPNELPFGAPEGAADPRDEWHGGRALPVRPFGEIPETLDETAETASKPFVQASPRASAPRSEYRFRGPAVANWDRPDAVRDEQRVASQTEERQQRDEEAAFDEESAGAPFDPAELAGAAQPAILEQSEGNAARRTRAEVQGSGDARRRGRLNATFPEFDEELETERAAPDLTAIEAELSRELEPRFVTADGDKWQSGDEASSEPRVAAAIAPGASRRAAAARAAAQQRGRSRLGLFAAAVILVVVFGGAAAFYLRGSESAPSGPPPVIAADKGAVRIEPAPGQQAASEGETVGDAVYNRVAGNSPSADEKVVDNSEEPKEVARIVLPQPQSNSSDTVVRAVGDNEAVDGADASAPATGATPPGQAPAAAANEGEIGPRRVPTFVVKADGSIVATSEAGIPPSDPAAAQDQQLTGETEPIKPVPVSTVAIAPASAPASDNAVAPPPPKPAASSVQASEELATLPAMADAPAPKVAAAEPAAAPPASPVEAPDQTAVATADPAAPPPAPTPGGGYSVQLSSEGSMADARSAYARAKEKFPAVLGQLDPQIQQADLGAKGIFYRVRVGPWAERKDAVALCESLKAAGGNCFVAK